MRPEDLILVSVDDHVVEPPDMFEHVLPAQWKARAPRVVRKKDGSDVWLFEGAQLPNIGLNAVAGRPPEEYGVEPTAYEQLRPGCWNVRERVRDMNANGVLASMCFPSYPSFCGALFARQPDKELARVMLQAYNDWHIDEWCGTHPGRFIPLALPIIWDPKLLAEEVRLFFCRHNVPGATWPPGLMEHPNGAVAIESFSILADDPRATAEATAQLLGRKAAQADGAMVVETGRAQLRFREKGSGRAGIDAIAVRVRDLEVARAALAAGGIEPSREDNALSVSREAANGVRLSFVRA